MFQIQFIAYRSHSAAATNELLQISGWSSDSIYLRRFLNGVNASYGQGAEALEVALQHVNRMVEKDNDEIARVLVIGDAPPTQSFADVQDFRQCYSSLFDWTQSEYFAQATFWKDELQKLVRNGITVDTYYLSYWAQNDFTTIANSTNGTCQYLDVNSSTFINPLVQSL